MIMRLTTGTNSAVKKQEGDISLRSIAGAWK